MNVVFRTYKVGNILAKALAVAVICMAGAFAEGQKYYRIEVRTEWKPKNQRDFQLWLNDPLLAIQTRIISENQNNISEFFAQWFLKNSPEAQYLTFENPRFSENAMKCDLGFEIASKRWNADTNERIWTRPASFDVGKSYAFSSDIDNMDFRITLSITEIDTAVIPLKKKPRREY